MNSLVKRASRLMIFIFGVSIPLISLTYTKKINLSFDSLFPKAAFENVLDESMQVLGEVENLRVKGEIEREFDFVNDIIVGKLFHIRICIENIKNQNPLVHQEDIQYLTKLMNKIAFEYKRVPFLHIEKTRSNYVFGLIKDIESRLQEMFR